MTARQGQAPIAMRLRESTGVIERSGDFTWSGLPGRVVLVVAIPDPEMRKGWCLSRWTIDHENRWGAQWSWNGDRARPTLIRSLHAVDTWHGWVRDGRLLES